MSVCVRARVRAYVFIDVCACLCMFMTVRGSSHLLVVIVQEEYEVRTERSEEHVKLGTSEEKNMWREGHVKRWTCEVMDM